MYTFLFLNSCHHALNFIKGGETLSSITQFSILGGPLLKMVANYQSVCYQLDPLSSCTESSNLGSIVIMH